MLQPLTEDELNSIYNWVDQIPLSRQKKNIARDFSDGVLMAEIVHFFLPKMIDVSLRTLGQIHNYSQANSVKQKRYNWDTLSQKVFKKIGFSLSKDQIESVIQCQPEAIERVLKFVQAKIEAYMESHLNSDEKKNANEGGNKPPVPSDWQKEQQIFELRETIDVLEQKLNRMDELMKQKDQKILRYQQLLQQNGLM